MTPAEAERTVRERFPFELPHPEVTAGSYKTMVDTVRRYLPPGSTILDFGCGPCDKLAILQLMGYQCSGYDDLEDAWHREPGNRERIFKFTEQCGINFQLATGDALPFRQGSFDMVMLHDVLEHLHDSPCTLLNDLLELVKPNGLLFITVPNAVNIKKRLNVMLGKTNLPAFEAFYWYPGKWRGHVREYVRNDLVLLAEYLGLDVVELRSKDHMLVRLPFGLRPLYLLLTKVFSGWKDSWMLVARKPMDWRPRTTLSSQELARIPGVTAHRKDSDEVAKPARSEVAVGASQQNGKV